MRCRHRLIKSCNFGHSHPSLVLLDDFLNFHHNHLLLLSAFLFNLFLHGGHRICSHRCWLQYSIKKLLSYTVFNVTGNKTAKERVYIWPRMKQSIPKLTLVWKSRGLSQVLQGDKKYTTASCGLLPKFWKIADFCQIPWSDTKHPSIYSQSKVSLYVYKCIKHITIA